MFPVSHAVCCFCKAAEHTGECAYNAASWIIPSDIRKLSEVLTYPDFSPALQPGKNSLFHGCLLDFIFICFFIFCQDSFFLHQFFIYLIHFALLIETVILLHIHPGYAETHLHLLLEEVTADSGYCSEKNLLYLKRNEISSYIKLQDHEKRKTRAYSEDISKYYNMRTGIFEDEQFYICHDGRELRHLRTESKEQDGYTQTFEVYGCADCSGCEHKARCLYKYDAEKDAEKNKVMKINEQWEELKERSHANIQSERGILKRQTHSIQTEGHGDIKENENFRRFNYRSADKVYKEFMLYAIGRNINKYHRFLYEKLRKFEGKTA